MLDLAKINSIISTIIDELLQKGRIDEEYKRIFYSSYDQPTLQIGVVGKMKTGKSALINAIIFGNDVLPSSPEPLTVTLTKITYGEKNISSVEFLSQRDIDSLNESASYSGNDSNLISQKEAAEEILTNLPSNYKEFLGKILTDVPNEDLKKYVASNGEYSGLVKSVVMGINNNNLKGITIIDTPGFNDPVVTRGETTTKFLSDCHVVLFVHTEDGYDQQDGALLNTQIEYAGISKLIDVFNRMDRRKSLSFEGWNKQLISFVEDRDEYVSEEKQPVVYSLIRDSDAVAVSAFMALCGLRPKETRSDFVKNQIAKFEERYPELTADESISLEEALVKYSNIGNIVSILNNIATNGKQYLIDKPLNTLIGKLKAIIEQIQSDIEVAKADLKLHNQDRNSALSDLEGLKVLMKSVKESISIDPLEIRLQDKIGDTRSRIQKEREEAQKSVTKQKYPEPKLFDSGVTKANIGAYNTFLSRFQSFLRNEINILSGQYGLESVANEYIRKTILSLVNSQISDDRRDNFEIKAKNKVKSQIQGVNVVIPAYSISSLPTGNAEQWSLLYTDFGKHYDDKTIESALLRFKEVCHDIGQPTFILHMLLQMEEEMIRELSQTPSEIKGKIDAINEKIGRLNEELQWAKNQLQMLNNIK